MDETVRSKVARLFEAFNERDMGSVLELCDPEVEFLPITAELARGGHAYVGHQGVRDYFTDVERVWEELKVIPGEIRPLDDAVLVLGRVLARSKEEGTRDLPVAWILRLSGDRIRSGRVYADPHEAERELGLS